LEKIFALVNFFSFWKD